MNVTGGGGLTELVDAYKVGTFGPNTYGTIGTDFKLLTPGGYPNVNGVQSFAIATAAVPEPASWALMIAGFGMAGAMLRSRQRRAVLVRI